MAAWQAAVTGVLAAVTVTVTVAVCVTVAVTVAVLVTVATGLAVVVAVEVAVGVVMALALLDVEPVEPVVDEVDPVVEEVLPVAGMMRGTQSEMKVASAASASVAALTAAAGSVAPPVPPAPPPVPPVPEGAPLDACDELVPDVADRDEEAVVAAARAVVLAVVDDAEAYVCWSVWYADIADLYAASAARTAFWSGVLLIEASA